MSQPPDNPSEPLHNRWQFSLRGMLLFTLSVAIGASVVKCNVHNWIGDQSQLVGGIKIGFGGGLIAILVFWMIFG
jgi:hypothetical protein